MKKSRNIKTKEVHLEKEAIMRLVKVTDTPKAWAIYTRLWDLSMEALAMQSLKADSSAVET